MKVVYQVERKHKHFAWSLACDTKSLKEAQQALKFLISNNLGWDFRLVKVTREVISNPACEVTK